MSVGKELIGLAVDVALKAAHETFDSMLEPSQKWAALNELAERAKFNAIGQRELDERHAKPRKDD